MRPVKQSLIHDPANGVQGDCQRAVIASLLELPLSSVPHFGEIAQGDSTIFWAEVQNFLASYGYVYVTTSNMIAFGDTNANFWHEIAGPSPRDPEVMHAVVGLNGNIAFDPHPDNRGLDPDRNKWQYSFLIPLATDVTG